MYSLDHLQYKVKIHQPSNDEGVLNRSIQTTSHPTKSGGGFHVHKGVNWNAITWFKQQANDLKLHRPNIWKGDNLLLHARNEREGDNSLFLCS